MNACTWTLIVLIAPTPAPLPAKAFCPPPETATEPAKTNASMTWEPIASSVSAPVASTFEFAM